METTRLSEDLERLAALIEASPHNLVSRRGREELRSRHIPESVHLARELPRSEERLRLLDVGSGGGLPGLVIALERSDLHVELLEARQKKVDFLRGASSQLGLAIPVHHGRAEDLVRSDLADTFDVVTARAVAPLARLIPWTVAFLRPGGLLYAVKGERWEEELQDAAGALLQAGATVAETPAMARGSAPLAPRVVIIGRAKPTG